jgi:hypothetical protein
VELISKDGALEEGRLGNFAAGLAISHLSGNHLPSLSLRSSKGCSVNTKNEKGSSQEIWQNMPPASQCALA